MSVRVFADVVKLVVWQYRGNIVTPINMFDLKKQIRPEGHTEEREIASASVYEAIYTGWVG